MRYTKWWLPALLAMAWLLSSRPSWGQETEPCAGWVPVGEPMARSRYSAAFDPVRGRLCLFGGVPFNTDYDRLESGAKDGWYFNTAVLGDYWEWDGRRWYSFEQEGPSPRMDAAIAVHPTTVALVLLGGVRQFPGGGTHTRSLINELWSRSDGYWTLHLSAIVPAARVRAAIAYDALERRLMLSAVLLQHFQQYSDLWGWDGSR